MCSTEPLRETKKRHKRLFLFFLFFLHFLFLYFFPFVLSISLPFFYSSCNFCIYSLFFSSIFRLAASFILFISFYAHSPSHLFFAFFKSVCPATTIRLCLLRASRILFGNIILPYLLLCIFALPFSLLFQIYSAHNSNQASFAN